MELELDLKITKTIDAHHSTNFRIAEDRAGPIFLSRETGTKFTLTSHLRGYRREDIKIDINKDGTQISIRGEKVVQEMVMKGWVMLKNEPNLKGFIKVFIIPQGVVLDRIKAYYNDDESTLTIYMPKHNKGIMIGGGIEEVNKDEKQVDDQESLHEKQLSEEEYNQVEDIRHENDGEEEINDVVLKAGRDIDRDYEASSIRETKGEEISRIQGEGKFEEEIIEEKLEDVCETRQCEKSDEESCEQHELEEGYNNKCRLFGPCFFIGSALVASLVTLLISLVKAKRH